MRERGQGSRASPPLVSRVLRGLGLPVPVTGSTVGRDGLGRRPRPSSILDVLNLPGLLDAQVKLWGAALGVRSLAVVSESQGDWLRC